MVRGKTEGEEPNGIRLNPDLHDYKDFLDNLAASVVELSLLTKELSLNP